MSSHRLEVETGRWTRPEKTSFENRKCKFCNNLGDSTTLFYNVSYIKSYENDTLQNNFGYDPVCYSLRSFSYQMLKRQYETWVFS